MSWSHVGISGSTAGAWLSVLEASGIVSLLEPWFTSRTRSLVKTPKLYVADPGLVAFLVGVRDVRSLGTSPLAGALWETFVTTELRRLQRHRTGGWDFHFWRDRTKEADYLFHRAGTFDLADAKWSEHPDGHDARRLQQVAAALPEGQVRRRALIARCAHAHPVAEGVEAVPVLDLGSWLAARGG